MSENSSQDGDSKRLRKWSGGSPAPTHEASASQVRCVVCGAFTKDGEIEVEIEDGLGEGRGPHIRHLHLQGLPRARQEEPDGD